MNRSRWWQAVVLALLTTVVPGPHASGAAAVKSAAACSGNWCPAYLRNAANTDKYLDADLNTWWGAHGTAQGWQFQGTVNQRWWADWHYESNTTIRTAGAPDGPGKCLTAVHASWVPSGWIAEVRACDSTPQQLWYIQLDDRLYNHGSSQCLELDAGAWNGYQVAMSPCRDATTVWFGSPA